MSKGACFVVMLALVLALGAGHLDSSLRGEPVSSRSGVQPTSEGGAQQQAAGLLAAVVLPAAASSSSIEPTGDGGLLAHPGLGPVATPNAVDLSGWWVVPGPPKDAVAYIAAHLPEGASETGRGRSDGPGVPANETRVFEEPTSAGDFGSTSQLVVLAVALADGSTGLRVDAQVIWQTPRPAEEVVPNGKLIHIAVGSSIGSNAPRPQRLRISTPAKVKAIVRLLNSLRAEQPGVRSCPSDPGTYIRLSFYTLAEGTPTTVAVLDPWGCGGVSITIDGRHEPKLESSLPPTASGPGEPLLRAIDRVIGRRLGVSPAGSTGREDRSGTPQPPE